MVEVVDVGISDRRLVKWTLDVESSPPVDETSSRRSWRGFDVETFRSALRESNLCDVNYVDSQSSIGDMVKEYDSTVVNILDRLAPITQVTRRTRRSDPWFDDDCRARKRETRRLERRYRTSTASSDRASWTSSVRKMHKYFATKSHSF